MIKPRTYLLTSLLGLAVALPGCEDAKPHVQTATRVEASPPLVQDVDVTLHYPIELEADETVAITPVAISGFLRRVRVDVGDRVKAGDLIAVVDCGEYAAQRQQAETAIKKREAQVDESRSRFDRLTRMGERLVSPTEVEQARAQARVAEAELADARAKLSEAQQRKGYCSLRAPFGGFVTERLLDPGAMVRPGGLPVVHIAKTREVRVVASVVEQDAPKVEKGAEADLYLRAFPGTTFRSTVARVGRSLDPSTRTLRIEIDIPNTTERLIPGMTGRAAIVVGKREKALLVPLTAVLQLEDVAYVYVIRDEDGQPRARRVEVKLGIDLGDWIEVREGLAADDQVITVGRELVDDGTWVESSPPQKVDPPPNRNLREEGDGDGETEVETVDGTPKPDPAKAVAAKPTEGMSAKGVDAGDPEAKSAETASPADPKQNPPEKRPAAAPQPNSKDKPSGQAKKKAESKGAPKDKPSGETKPATKSKPATPATPPPKP